MGAEIDRLEIQVEAQATKANNQLDKLVTKLDRVSGALSNLNSSGLTGLSNGVSKFAQASAQLSNVKTADFTRLTKNIDKLANLNTQQIYSAASSMRTLSSAINSLSGVSTGSLQVAEVAKSIGKLGGANVQKAIANLPALATTMNNFMGTMAKAPQVSNNVIQMTRALADLASQGAKVGTAGNSLTASTNRIGTSMEKTTKKARSFSSVLGSIYQKYFWIMRAGNKLWDSVKESMGYVEVLNYFDAAFGQVADSAVGQWEDAGYDSAQAYFNSFSERAKQLTTKMTGFTITDNGMLESTGGKSLGINPSMLMNYQAMFAQMSNSMGVTAETSLKLSTALTEIGADLASVKNMDFDKVWKDMASGLVGMSRTLDKYGANIRNVNLQQKLTELGINANVSALNQNEKALLRTIILLDSTRYAWGDLAETINSPANQLRLLQANFSNLARAIGNIFLPIVAKVLPYINALVIALQRLAEWIVKLLGFEDFDWGGASGAGGSGFDDLLGSIGDTEEGLNDATKAAKKLKTQLLGIDELNVLNQDDESSGDSMSGLGGYSGLLEGALDKILDEYQKAWDEAFANMEERYNQFADNVAKAFKEKGLYGVGEYFSKGITNALNNIPWETIYDGAKGFGTGLADFLNGLISPELFGAVGKTIASSLNTAIYTALSFGQTFDFYDLGASIASGINSFFETFDFASVAETMNVWADGLKDAIRGFLDTISWDSVLEGATNFLGTLEIDTIAIAIGGFALMHGVLPLTSKRISTIIGGKFNSLIAEAFGTGGTAFLAKGATAFTLSATVLVAFEFVKDFSEWKKNIDEYGWDEGRKKTASENQANPYKEDSAYSRKMAERYTNWGIVETDVWGKFVEGAKESFEEIETNFSIMKGELILTPDMWNESLDTNKKTFNQFFEDVGTSATAFFDDLYANKIKEFVKNTSDKWKDWKDSISDKLKETKENISQTWNNIKTNTTEFLTNMGTNIREKWESIREDISTKVENIRLKISQVWGNIKQNTIDFLTNIRNKFQTTWDNIKSKVSTVANNIYTTVTEKFEAIRSTVKNTMDKAASAINSFKDSISNAISKIRDFFDWSDRDFKISLPTDVFKNFTEKVSNAIANLKEFFGFDGKSVSVSSNISGGGSARGYATGGYPASASLFWAGEDGVPEILGTVGGRTAVAGGAEITGIRDAVYSTGQAETALLQTAVNLLQIIADKDPSINVDGRDLVDAYDTRKARNGYAF